MLNWQPTLHGHLIHLRPLMINDFEALYAIASDHLIWEQHPHWDRYKRDVFQGFFDSAMTSKGALAIVDPGTGDMIGSSRFTGHHMDTSSIEIGYTFLARKYWRKGHNRELKAMMLDYAFQYVDTVHFSAGKSNHRSRKALSGIGAKEVCDMASVPIPRDLSDSVVYEIKKANYCTK